MNDECKLILGLAFLGLIVLSLCSYAAWNVRKKGIRRAANEDAKLVKSGAMKESELFEQIQSIVPSLLTANSVLAGITIAAVLIIIAVMISQQIHLQGMKQWIVLTGLCLSSVSAICWLLSIEQLTQMKAPSVDFNRLLRFQSYTYNLWIIGLVLLFFALYLFLLLAHPYVAMITAFVTAWIMVGYWKIHNEW